MQCRPAACLKMQRTLIVVMGPSACGKSLVGQALAAAISADFIEGDDFHPPSNIAKMSSGRPLTDADREAWLNALLAQVEASSKDRVILACSALTSFAQARLRQVKHRAIRFALLRPPYEVLEERIRERKGHFMPPSLLASQLEALEVPPDALTVNSANDVRSIVAEIMARLFPTDGN